MAEHKVPQDVEAEDKLLGPFSFRQFVYLLIAVGAGALMFFLGRLAIPLAIIPAPVFVLFGVLALPLRKDQPMEAYLAAMIRFYFTPHLRLWDPDGQESLIEISNPVVDDAPKTKEIGGDEAARRLSFLADVEDTQGWATRGAGAPINTTNLNDDLAVAAIDAPDIMDDSLSHSLDDMLNQSNQQVKQEALARMQRDATTAPSFANPVRPDTGLMDSVAPALTAPTVNLSDEASAEALLAQASAGQPLHSQPVMRQTTIQPLSAKPFANPAPTATSSATVGTDSVPSTITSPTQTSTADSAVSQPTVAASAVTPGPIVSTPSSSSSAVTSDDSQTPIAVDSSTDEVSPKAEEPSMTVAKVAESTPPTLKSDTIESGGDFVGEETISHTSAGDDSDNDEVEISLH